MLGVFNLHTEEIPLNSLFQNRKLRTNLLCLLSGVLLGLSFPPFHTWYFVYFGMVLLLYLIFDSGRVRQVFGRAYLSILVFNEITVYWISGWHSDDIFLKIGGIATVLVHPVFFMIPVLILYGISKIRKGESGKNLALLLFPFIWVGFEFFHNQWQLTFPWLELGNTETYNLNRIQYIEYTGVHGISFLICVISALMYYLLEKISTRKWKLTSKGSILVYTILFLLLLLPNFYSFSRLNQDKSKYFQSSDSTKTVNICIAQSNTDPFKKWEKDGQEKTIASYMEKLHEGLRYNPDMLLLHETATPYYFLEDYNGLKSKVFTDFVDSTGKFLLMGIPHLEYYKDSTFAPNDAKRMMTSGRLYDTYNAAILLEPLKNKKESTIHKKARLVPFSERVPYQEHLKFLKDWFTWGVGLSGWQFGKEMTVFTLKSREMNIDTKFSVLICFESVFSDFVREGTRDGAEFLIIVTNDGWFGHTSGPVQHEQYAVLRAIENRKWIARCAQTGISCYIDPLGNIYERIPYGTEGVIDRTIYANTEKTFYVEYGDVTGRISFYTGILCLVACIVNYVYRKTVKNKP